MRLLLIVFICVAAFLLVSENIGAVSFSDSVSNIISRDINNMNRSVTIKLNNINTDMPIWLGNGISNAQIMYALSLITESQNLVNNELISQNDRLIESNRNLTNQNIQFIDKINILENTIQSMQMRQIIMAIVTTILGFSLKIAYDKRKNVIESLHKKWGWFRTYWAKLGRVQVLKT